MERIVLELVACLFLDPFIFGKRWEDISTPRTSTLAHELYFRFGGQYAFKDRLIPQAEKVLGGTYTVRGYHESAAAGDTAFVGTVEYRFHFARALRPRPNPHETTLFGRPFRFAPQHVFGQPDWDFVIKPFFDWGQTIVSSPVSPEHDETLMSVGIGAELRFLRNAYLYCYWAHPLMDVNDNRTGSCGDVIHFGVSLLW